ncbi:uncharacterized protein LOC132194919 [Neocloeon triangulifer]|uniref:uncharacterized protein LOC132194919 n=1 Tax=Neocloeon triangulifer TaxID=2078957 RepID=UPI00286F67A1|nr:uncharacterized protein LOC132194919 [Neocloeon triangulifer]
MTKISGPPPRGSDRPPRKSNKVKKVIERPPRTMITRSMARLIPLIFAGPLQSVKVPKSMARKAQIADPAASLAPLQLEKIQNNTDTTTPMNAGPVENIHAVDEEAGAVVEEKLIQETAKGGENLDDMSEVVTSTSTMELILSDFDSVIGEGSAASNSTDTTTGEAGESQYQITSDESVGFESGSSTNFQNVSGAFQIFEQNLADHSNAESFTVEDHKSTVSDEEAEGDTKNAGPLRILSKSI